MVYSLPGIRLPTAPSLYNSTGSTSFSFHRDRSPSLFLTKLPFPRKILYWRTSCDSNSSSFEVAASEKVLAPSNESNGSSSSTEQTEARDPQVLQNDDSPVAHVDNMMDNEDGELKVADTSVPFHETISKESDIIRQRTIPPPGVGTKIYEIDPLLSGYHEHLDYSCAQDEVSAHHWEIGRKWAHFNSSSNLASTPHLVPKYCVPIWWRWCSMPESPLRFGHYKRMREAIDKYEGGLEAFSRGYEKFGFIRSATGITYREWAPGAKSAALIGDFNNWNPDADIMTQNEFGVWEIFLPNNVDGSPPIPHGSHVKIRMDTQSGIKDSIPAWIKFSTQAPGEIPFNGIYYDPPEEDKYVFQHPRPKKPKSLRIYEAHVGMSSTEPIINSYANFRDEVLPRIKKLGYNAVQIMAIQEHSYYASFGYHVTNFFAPSSRCGTPDDLKSLIDRAHELGLLVLMDIVHSHASNNTLDGLNMFDGTDSHYFHSGLRGYHWIWDSRLFNYGHWEVLRFLLSNARWWLDEYKFDGFRFDGVTSMMYTHHGLQVTFTGNYSEYFGFTTDVDAVVYLMLVNDVIHELFPQAISIGEDVSGMPTFCIPVCDGGVGFDYRLHMAIADKWIELLKKQDEEWKMGDIVHTLTNRRWSEKCVAYAESHDQALVGDKTLAFWLMDKDMYDFMSLDGPSTTLIDRGIALHKMIRLITMGLGGDGYLNFMGNEFGHPEWIDFPRADQNLPDGKFVPGNNNSFDKCRRRFDLGDAEYLRYHELQEFDQAMHHVEQTSGFMSSDHQYISRKDEGDRIIVFERGDMVFVFNFHWINSYSDYRVGCLKPGKYKVILDSDDEIFGGLSRIDHEADYFTFEGFYDNRPRSFMVYAPSRTAVVYRLVEDHVKPVLGGT